MRYLIITILSFVHIIAVSQDQFIFKHLNTKDGLSNNWVRCSYMDDIGFMWFGTSDGLNKYDGHVFSIYRPETINGKSIGNINISAITKKSQNELWVCTDLGLYIYNYLKDKLLPYDLKSVTVRCVLEDKEHNFWFGTSDGLFRYNSTTGKISRHPLFRPAMPDNPNEYVNALFEDIDSNIWIGTKAGLKLYIRKTGIFKTIKIGSEEVLPSNDIYAICQDHKKQLWIGVSRVGLFYAVPDSSKIEFNRVLSGQIIRLLLDHERKLWISLGSGEGLYRLDLNRFVAGKNVRFDHFIKNTENQNSLSDNSVFSLYEDNFKDIWIGTFGAGLNYFNRRSKKFKVVVENPEITNTIKNNLVNTFYEDENQLYIGTEGGLDILNKKTGIFEHFANEPDNLSSLSSNAVYAIYKDSHGNLWIGTWAEGLNLFNQNDKLFKRFKADNKPGSISNSNIFSITEDNKGNLWIGTIGGGLNRYNYNTGTFTHYKNNKEDTTSLYGDFVNQIYQTRSGKLYICVENSLDLYDYGKDNFTHFRHDVKDTASNFGNILSVYEDSRNTLWIATNAGLEYFDETSSLFVPIFTNNQLPDNTIQGILEDGQGNLWISTNKGISKFLKGVTRPDEPVVFHYTSEDGLSGNEFKKRSAYKNKQGVFYFGSSNGYTYFHPDSIHLNTIPPEVILSSFDVQNALAIDQKYIDISKQINFLKEVELPYRNSDFAIGFAALNYLNPQNNHFKYMLEGYDHDWIASDNSQSVRYTNLNPGQYIFRVMASNNDGIWCSEAKTLSIIIYPPWWKTIAFKIVALILTLLLLFVLFKLRFRILESQKKELEFMVNLRTKELHNINVVLEQKQEEITLQFEQLSNYKNHLELLVDERTADLKAAKEKAEESDRLKTAFLQNMSHEIRTPLNAIMGFSELLPERFHDKKDLIKYSKIIRQKGDELLWLINEILDISKIEAGTLRLYPIRFKISTLFQEIEFVARENQSRINKETIQFQIVNHCSNEHFEMVTDLEKLKQICFNLINNAFKFTNSGKIEFGCISENPDEIKFYVSDTGIGIPEDKYELIFERFRQLDELHYNEGTGLGLSISRGLTELLGGKIWLISKVNQGTTFYFTLPLRHPEN